MDENGQNKARSRLKLVGGALLSVWLFGGIGVGGMLMTGHWAALPTGARHYAGALAALFPAGGWRVVHVLGEDCGCSAQVGARLDLSLAARQHVLLVGETAASSHERTALESRGLPVTALTAAELEQRFGLTAAPTLLILNPAGRLNYEGGYTDRKRGAAPATDHILANLQRHIPVAPLPVFGCALTAKLRETLDPLGLKYP